MAPIKGLKERLSNGESIICAEGYLSELERRGVVKHGPFMSPEVVLDHPHQVRSLHEEFVLAGSDVVVACTFNSHRLAQTSDTDVESLNRHALRLARGVADHTATLMAAPVCTSRLYDPDDATSWEIVNKMFEEQVKWAVEEGADYIIAESFTDLGEAKLALEAIKKVGNGLPAVVTLTAYSSDLTTDDVDIVDALVQLESLGADVVGLNGGRGPNTMLPLLARARTMCMGPLAALPVPFRTSDAEKTQQSLTDPVSGDPVYPLDLDCCRCSRNDVSTFAQKALALGMQYVGLCSGCSSHMLREVAMGFGRTPSSAIYAPDMNFCVLAQAKSAHVQKRQFFAFARTYNLPR